MISEGFHEEPYQEVDLCLDLAILLYEAGATVQRVSDSVRWFAGSLGYEGVHVFVGYEAIELSVHQDNHTENRLYVLREPARVNVSVLHQVSILLHELPRYHGDLDLLRSAISGIRHQPPVYPMSFILLMTGFACAAFGLLNRADLSALLVIGISSFSALFLRHWYAGILHNLYVTTLMTTLTGGLCAVLLTQVVQTRTPEVALISSVLFLIPGSMLINGGMDIIRDHTGSGISRLTSVFTQICIIAGSLLIPLSVMDLSFQSLVSGTDSLSLIFVPGLAAGIAACGFAILFNTPASLLPWCFLCGITARLVREVGLHLGFDPFLCILSGMVIATILAAGIGRVVHVPEVILAVIAGIPMVPGLAMIQGLQGLFAIAHLGSVHADSVFLFTIQQMLYAVVTVLALVGGIIVPLILIARKKPRI